MNENKKSYTIQIFILLAAWVCLPLVLFVLGVISKQWAYIIFAAFALPIIIYYLLPIFSGKDNFGSEANQLSELSETGVSELNTTDLEVETVVWRKDKR